MISEFRARHAHGATGAGSADSPRLSSLASLSTALGMPPDCLTHVKTPLGGVISMSCTRLDSKEIHMANIARFSPFDDLFADFGNGSRRITIQ